MLFYLIFTRTVSGRYCFYPHFLRWELKLLSDVAGIKAKKKKNLNRIFSLKKKKRKFGHNIDLPPLSAHAELRVKEGQLFA